MHVFSIGKLLVQLLNLAALAGLVVLCILAGRALWRKGKAQPPQQEPPSAQSLGQVLQAHRQARHMTQESVAEALGVSRQAVSKWESDASLPNAHHLAALAALFGATAEEIYQAADGTPSSPHTL